MGVEKHKPCREMVKVRFFLMVKKIEWMDESDEYREKYIHRTVFWLGGHKFSIINGVGTYGGAVNVGFVNQGLLEMRIDEREPRGNMTGKECIDVIKGYL